MADFNKTVIGSILGLLFIFCMLTFFIALANEYDKDPASLSNEYYDFGAINESLANVQAEAEDFRTSASKGSESSGVFGLVTGFFNGVGAFFGIAFSMFGFISDLFSLGVVGTLNIIFANPIITGTLIGIVIIVVLFAIFRFLKAGA